MKVARLVVVGRSHHNVVAEAYLIQPELLFKVGHYSLFKVRLTAEQGCPLVDIPYRIIGRFEGPGLVLDIAPFLPEDDTRSFWDLEQTGYDTFSEPRLYSKEGIGPHFEVPNFCLFEGSLTFAPAQSFIALPVSR